MPDQLLNPAILLAVALPAAIVGGYVAKFLHIPRVVGYLVMGLGLKQAAGIWLKHEDANKLSEPLQLATELTLGLILFTIGGVFEFRRLKAVRKTLLKISFWENSATGFGTAVACGIATFLFMDADWTLSLTVGMLLGAVAVATAPAATYLVIREYEAKGPNTDHILGLTGINNLLILTDFLPCFEQS